MGKYSIIIADDNDMVRDFYNEILTERGFEIYTADKNIDLLKKYNEKPTDIIIMDTLDSGINKELRYPEVIGILRDINPKVKIIFASGLNVSPEQFEKEFKVPFLEKPFKYFDLFKKLSEVLREEKENYYD
jgi:DNA-binding NtrC family response regulator